MLMKHVATNFQWKDHDLRAITSIDLGRVHLARAEIAQKVMVSIPSTLEYFDVLVC